MSNPERSNRAPGPNTVAVYQPRGDDGAFVPGGETRQLTDKQREFVRQFADNGGDYRAAALGAGYSPDSSTMTGHLLRLPWIRAELERERGRLLAELDVKSLAVLRGVLEDSKAALQHRLKAAEIVQKVRGQELAGRDKAKDDKDLANMTIAELEAYIRVREEGLQRVGEAPTMAGSAPVSEPQSPQVIDNID